MRGSSKTPSGRSEPYRAGPARFGLQAGGRENSCKRSPQRHREHGEKKEGCGKTRIQNLHQLCLFVQLFLLCVSATKRRDGLRFAPPILRARGRAGEFVQTFTTETQRTRRKGQEGCGKTRIQNLHQLCLFVQLFLLCALCVSVVDRGKRQWSS